MIALEVAAMALFVCASVVLSDRPPEEIGWTLESPSPLMQRQPSFFDMRRNFEIQVEIVSSSELRRGFAGQGDAQIGHQPRARRESAPQSKDDALTGGCSSYNISIECIGLNLTSFPASIPLNVVSM